MPLGPSLNTHPVMSIASQTNSIERDVLIHTKQFY